MTAVMSPGCQLFRHSWFPPLRELLPRPTIVDKEEGLPTRGSAGLLIRLCGDEAFSLRVPPPPEPQSGQAGAEQQQRGWLGHGSGRSDVQDDVIEAVVVVNRRISVDERDGGRGPGRYKLGRELLPRLGSGTETESVRE